MPGILGYLDPEKKLPPGTLARMAQPLQHLPTYRTELLERPWGAVGAVSHDAFPGNGAVHIVGATRRFVFAGEVLAPDPGSEISPRDPTALARCAFGETLSVSHLAALRGSFAAAILDEADASINLVTDHFGLQPLYMARAGSVVLFASEQKAILASGIIPFELDRIALGALLCIGEVFGNRTLNKEVETVPSATWLRLSADGTQATRFWTYEYREDPASRWDDAVNRAGNALDRAVARACSGRPSVAVPLSGGLDSRFLASLARERLPVRTYSWGTSGCRDLRYAEEIARALDIHHESFVFDPTYPRALAADGVWWTEGQTPITNFHVLPYVARLAETDRVVLDGFAGDAVLGGNFIGTGWHDARTLDDASERLWAWRLSAWRGDSQPCLASKLRAMETAAHDEFVALYRFYRGDNTMDRAMAFLIDNRVRRNTICGSSLLRVRLATQQPFLDVDFVNEVRTLPHAWRRRHEFYLAVLRRFAPVAARCRWQRTMLPAAWPFSCSWTSLAAQRGLTSAAAWLRLPDPFPGKSPSRFALWLRGPLASWVRSIALDPRTLDRNWLPADLVREALDGHMQGRFDSTGLLGTVLAIELFARQFVDEFDLRLSSMPARPLAAGGGA